VPAQLVHRLLDGRHFEDIATQIARSTLPGWRRRGRMSRPEALAIADQQLLLFQRMQRAFDFETRQSGCIENAPRRRRSSPDRKKHVGHRSIHLLSLNPLLLILLRFSEVTDDLSVS
jgi:hypothetical protein